MADNGQLFNSKTNPVPFIRPELDIIPVESDGKSFLYFYDMLGYTTPNFALNSQISTVLSLLDGNKSVKDLSPYFGDGVTTDQILEYIRFLDEHCLLYSNHFKQHAETIEKEYESSSVHQSTTAGTSYPSNPGELTSFLDEAFSKYATNGLPAKTHAKALYAPHIDPRIGLESYVKAFNSIKDLTPRRVIILATSHYSDLYPKIYNNKPFVISKKDFEMPLGTIKTDRQSIDLLLEQSYDAGLSEQDRAHRIEHSIELHLVFLSHLWKHDYQIIPILVGGFDELYYMENGHLSKQVEQFSRLINEFFGDDKDTLFLISGDLAHIGKKFGDEAPAASLFNEVKSFDRMFMDYARKGNGQALLDLMKTNYDLYRICGFAPLYTFLKSMPGVSGRVLCYDLWDESERESAVTFGSILYSD